MIEPTKICQIAESKPFVFLKKNKEKNLTGTLKKTIEQFLCLLLPRLIVVTRAININIRRHCKQENFPSVRDSCLHEMNDMDWLVRAVARRSFFKTEPSASFRFACVSLFDFTGVPIDVLCSKIRPENRRDCNTEQDFRRLSFVLLIDCLIDRYLQYRLFLVRFRFFSSPFVIFFCLILTGKPIGCSGSKNWNSSLSSCTVAPLELVWGRGVSLYANLHYKSNFLWSRFTVSVSIRYWHFFTVFLLQPHLGFFSAWIQSSVPVSRATFLC